MSMNYVPNRKVSISEIHDDLWDMNLQVNRAVWRKLSFGQQHEIGKVLSEFQANFNYHKH